MVWALAALYLQVGLTAYVGASRFLEPFHINNLAIMSAGGENPFSSEEMSGYVPFRHTRPARLPSTPGEDPEDDISHVREQLEMQHLLGPLRQGYSPESGGPGYHPHEVVDPLDPAHPTGTGAKKRKWSPRSMVEQSVSSPTFDTSLLQGAPVAPQEPVEGARAGGPSPSVQVPDAAGAAEPTTDVQGTQGHEEPGMDDQAFFEEMAAAQAAEHADEDEFVDAQEEGFQRALYESVQGHAAQRDQGLYKDSEDFTQRPPVRHDPFETLNPFAGGQIGRATPRDPALGGPIPKAVQIPHAAGMIMPQTQGVLTTPPGLNPAQAFQHATTSSSVSPQAYETAKSLDKFDHKDDDVKVSQEGQSVPATQQGPAMPQAGGPGLSSPATQHQPPEERPGAAPPATERQQYVSKAEETRSATFQRAQEDYLRRTRLEAENDQLRRELKRVEEAQLVTTYKDGFGKGGETTLRTPGETPYQAQGTKGTPRLAKEYQLQDAKMATGMGPGPVSVVEPGVAQDGNSDHLNEWYTMPRVVDTHYAAQPVHAGEQPQQPERAHGHG